MVRFTSQPLYLWRKSPCNPHNKRVGGAQNQSGCFRDDKNHFPLPDQMISLSFSLYPSHYTKCTILAPVRPCIKDNLKIKITLKSKVLITVGNKITISGVIPCSLGDLTGSCDSPKGRSHTFITLSDLSI